mmetsp:Transcript_19108/g.38477  ORF Transcript_19108/g.38477 Transcript_19108/m.38477 type:complete len:116 (-) Transcript_19108:1275-1622(-)
MHNTTNTPWQMKTILRRTLDSSAQQDYFDCAVRLKLSSYFSSSLAFRQQVQLVSCLLQESVMLKDLSFRSKRLGFVSEFVYFLGYCTSAPHLKLQKPIYQNPFSLSQQSKIHSHA